MAAKLRACWLCRLGIDYFDHARRDHFAQGDIDSVVLDLVVELGRLEDLQVVCGQLPESSTIKF